MHAILCQLFIWKLFRSTFPQNFLVLSVSIFCHFLLCYSPGLFPVGSCCSSPSVPPCVPWYFPQLCPINARRSITVQYPSPLCTWSWMYVCMSISLNFPTTCYAHVRLRGGLTLRGKTRQEEERRNGVPRVPTPASSDPRLYSTFNLHSFNLSLPHFVGVQSYDLNGMRCCGSLKQKLWIMTPDNIDEWKRRCCCTAPSFHNLMIENYLFHRHVIYFLSWNGAFQHLRSVDLLMFCGLTPCAPEFQTISDLTIVALVNLH